MLRMIEVFGILAFTLSGVIEARRKKMDFVGTYAIAFLTSLGAAHSGTFFSTGFPCG